MRDPVLDQLLLDGGELSFVSRGQSNGMRVAGKRTPGTLTRCMNELGAENAAREIFPNDTVVIWRI